MHTLSIETASEACSVALFSAAGELLAHDHRTIGRGHAEMLVPMIAGLPENGRADRILVSLGPGSFTGVRIGLATARALGIAWGAQVLGYPTLALVAAMARQHATGCVTVCMNGGHGEWFVQDFGPSGLPEAEVASLAPEQVHGRSHHPLIAGNKAAEYVSLRGSNAARSLVILPDARQVLRLPDVLLTRGLSPTYGRAPDAMPLAMRPTA